MKTLAHEICNQLAIAAANIEAFIDKKFEPSEARLTAVLEALRSAENLVTNSALAEPERPQTRYDPIDVCELVDSEVIGLEAYAVERGVRLRIEDTGFQRSPCKLFVGDRTRIVQIVANLVRNAVHFTPSGGLVTIRRRRENDQFIVTVEDEGPGIEPGDLPRIFELGFRGAAARDIPGSGIGLAVVHRFVQEFGGAIHVVTRRDVGTTFEIRLPGHRVFARERLRVTWVSESRSPQTTERRRSLERPERSPDLRSLGC